MIRKNSTSSNHIGLLFQKYLRYNGKLALIAMIALIGTLLLLLYSIQIVTRFDTWRYEHFMYLFMGCFIVLAIVYSGSSFPGLRSKERSYQYLMLPAPVGQKFIFELFTRIILFLIAMPLLYWAVFHFEGRLVAWLIPEFKFQSFSFTQGFKMPTQSENAWVMLLVASQGMLFLTIPFYGATLWMKHPIIKTMACAAAILFFHLMLFYAFNRLHIRLFQTSWDFTVFMSSYLLLINFAAIILAYFKLKNKQV